MQITTENKIQAIQTYRSTQYDQQALPFMIHIKLDFLHFNFNSQLIKQTFFNNKNQVKIDLIQSK